VIIWCLYRPARHPPPLLMLSSGFKRSRVSGTTRPGRATGRHKLRHNRPAPEASARAENYPTMTTGRRRLCSSHQAPRVAVFQLVPARGRWICERDFTGILSDSWSRMSWTEETAASLHIITCYLAVSSILCIHHTCPLALFPL